MRLSKTELSLNKDLIEKEMNIVRQSQIYKGKWCAVYDSGFS